MPIASLLRPSVRPSEAALPLDFSLSADAIRSILRHARPLGHREEPDELISVSGSCTTRWYARCGRNTWW